MFSFNKLSIIFCFFCTCVIFKSTISFGQPGFVPTDLPGLDLWLAADVGVTLNGSDVQQWDDLSGNGNNAVQLVASKQPLLVPNQLNNKPIIHFGKNGADGEDTYLTIPQLNYLAGNFTVFYCYKTTSAPRVLSFIVGGTGTGLSTGGTGFPGIVTYDGTNILQSNLGYSAHGINVHRNNQIYRNNNLLTTNGLPIGNISFSSIGARIDFTTGFFYGDLAEILIYNSALTLPQIDSVELYIRQKYAPPISLGPDSTALDFCAINLAVSTEYSNLTWSTGETSSSISVNQSGDYWVEGTDVFGFVTRDTISVTYPELQIPLTTGICVNQSINWDPQLDPTFSYLWSTGATSTTLNISSAGPYSVQVTDGLGCIVTSSILNFTVDTYEQTAFLGNDTSLCIGNLISLQVGAAETVSYLWPDASAGTNYLVDTTGNYFVESVNVNGCLAQDTILITIAGQAPTADFSFSNECNGAINNFGDLSVPSGMDALAIWSWDFGDGNNSSAQNPSHVYLAPGTYDVELYVESIGGCGAFQTEQVIIHTLPTAVIGSIGHCSGQEVQFSNSSFAGSGAITDYFWDFDMPWTGAYNNSTVTVPNRIFDTAGSYDVMMVVSDANSCTDTVYQIVIIDQTPAAAFTAPDACVGEFINFANTSNGGVGLTYLWDFGDVTFSILATPSKSYTTYGARNITLSVTASNGCTDTAMRTVYVNPNPVIDFTFGPHCFGSYMDMNSASSVAEGSIVSNMWIINNADTVYGDPAYFLIDLMGQNEIELTSTSAVGCSTADLQFFDVVDTLIASFNVGTGIVAIGDPIQFNNTSIGAGIMLWNFDDGTFSTEVNPIHTYSGFFSDSTLVPYLIAINAAGCKDTAYQTIQLATPRIDLELQTIFTQENTNSYTVGIKLLNAGTVNITDSELEMWTEKGLLFTESWNGLLLPGESFIYVFNGKPNVAVNSEDIGDAFICIEGLGFNANGIAESYLANNKSCKNIEGENVILLPIFPNPVVESMTLQVIVETETEFTISLYDSRGREIQTIVPTQTLPSGLYSYAVEVQSIANGTYFVRMINGENERMEKIVISK